MTLKKVAVIKVFGKTPEKLKLRKKKRKRTILHKNSFGANYTMPSANNGTSSNGVLTSNGLDTCHNNSSNGGVNTNGTIPTANGTVGHTENHSNHVVHPTVVRANIPFKRKVNEVKRAATKAKRAARSQLGRSGKKGSRSQKDPIASPSDSSKSVPAAVVTPSNTRESRVKDRLSSRFSIISFKTFRPKSLSPDKQKGKSSDKNKSKSSSDMKNKGKSTKNQNRSRSPDKKRRGLEGSESPEKHKRSHSPNKRGTKEDERRKSRNRSVSPDKMRRSSSPDKYQRHRNRSPDKHRKMSEGNWLINKFLADEERQAKPIMNGSLICSMNDSLSSVNTVGGPNGSPLTVVRNGSTRALIATNTSRASPIRGIVNEAFISSPRGARTHSSLRVTKSVSPEGFDFDIGPSKYRRSISMEAYNRPPPASPDKRKRSVLDEGLGKDKKRRFSSPEKHFRVSSPAKGIRHDRSHNNILDVLERRRSSISPPSSKHSSKNNSYSSVPERLREKLSLITASPSGSIASITASVEPHAASVEPTVDTVSIISSHSSHSASRCTPKEWV